MIEKRAEAGGILSTATYSECGRYRYALTRVWSDGPRVVFVMLNPSKATEAANDPTIERCQRRAQAFGCGGFRACNIFALRETDPRKLRADPVPVGPENEGALSEAADWGDWILCAWGAHGAHLGQGARTAEHLVASGTPLYHLGLTKNGHPRHPLYVAYATRPQPWVNPLICLNTMSPGAT